jgi:hypothetical protein
VTAASALAAVESLEAYSSGLSYSFGSREGRAVLTLGVAQPGWFVIEAPGAPAVSGGSSLAVGSSIGGGIVRIAVPATAAILGAISGAIAIFVRRSRARRAPDRQHLCRVRRVSATLARDLDPDRVETLCGGFALTVPPAVPAWRGTRSSSGPGIPRGDL